MVGVSGTLLRLNPALLDHAAEVPKVFILSLVELMEILQERLAQLEEAESRLFEILALDLLSRSAQVGRQSLYHGIVGLEAGSELMDGSTC